MSGERPDRELVCADGERHLLLWPDDDAAEWAAVIDGPYLGCGPHRVRRYRRDLSVVSEKP